MDRFLEPSKYIDFDHPVVAEKAASLSGGSGDKLATAIACFMFVRDEIKHSWDHKMNPVTCKASDVLKHGTGYCYAKSHLLAALLRANGIPTGLCYQRLTFNSNAPSLGLHGLNAVYLESYGWYRIDARGNKPGVSAEFCPPIEKLAFPIISEGEADLPEIWPEPLPVVVRVLESSTDYLQVSDNLPDVLLINANNRCSGHESSLGSVDTRCASATYERASCFPMHLTKLELARQQIEKAIKLLVDEHDYVCSLTLAGAAEEMLGNMLRAQGKESVLAELHPWFNETYNSEISFSELAKGANIIRDELKHGHENPDPEHQVEMSKAIAAQMLMRALVNFPRVAGSPSQTMYEAMQWMQKNYKVIFAEWIVT